ncbi:hypothetical protein BDZ45DRAFT_353509, partial [Acephala macrosclerotiorum]
ARCPREDKIPKNFVTLPLNSRKQNGFLHLHPRHSPHINHPRSGMPLPPRSKRLRNAMALNLGYRLPENGAQLTNLAIKGILSYDGTYGRATVGIDALYAAATYVDPLVTGVLQVPEWVFHSCDQILRGGAILLF